MVIFAVDTVGAAPSGKKEAKIGSTFFIEKICSCIPNIKLRIASGQSSLFIFFVFGTNVLRVPKVILFITFLVRIIIRKRCLNLFSCWSLFCFSELNPFILLLLKIFFWDVLVNVKAKFWGFRFEGR